jgi:hypothetical protein
MSRNGFQLPQRALEIARLCRYEQTLGMKIISAPNLLRADDRIVAFGIKAVQPQKPARCVAGIQHVDVPGQRVLAISADDHPTGIISVKGARQADEVAELDQLAVLLRMRPDV